MSAVCIRFSAAALSENDAKQLHATVVKELERSENSDFDARAQSQDLIPHQSRELSNPH
jgi:hypothetical protein